MKLFERVCAMVVVDWMRADGLKVADIAKKTGKSEKTIRRWIRTVNSRHTHTGRDCARPNMQNTEKAPQDIRPFLQPEQGQQFMQFKPCNDKECVLCSEDNQEHDAACAAQ